MASLQHRMGLHRRMHTHPTPHQSLSATASPKGEAKETHQPCRGDHRSPAFVRRLFFLPPSLREVARQRRAGRSLAESKTPPVTFRLRMRACGQSAQHGAMFYFHQSLISHLRSGRFPIGKTPRDAQRLVQLSPKGSLARFPFLQTLLHSRRSCCIISL